MLVVERVKTLNLERKKQDNLYLLFADIFSCIVGFRFLDICITWSYLSHGRFTKQYAKHDDFLYYDRILQIKKLTDMIFLK